MSFSAPLSPTSSLALELELASTPPPPLMVAHRAEMYTTTANQSERDVISYCKNKGDNAKYKADAARRELIRLIALQHAAEAAGDLGAFANAVLPQSTQVVRARHYDERATKWFDQANRISKFVESRAADRRGT